MKHTICSQEVTVQQRQICKEALNIQWNKCNNEELCKVQLWQNRSPGSHGSRTWFTELLALDIELGWVGDEPDRKYRARGCHFRKANDNSKVKEVGITSLPSRTVVDLVSDTYLLNEWTTERLSKCQWQTKWEGRKGPNELGHSLPGWCAGLICSRTLVLKVWILDLQQHDYLQNCYKWKLSGPNPDLLNQELWE